jgi:hypothetical protein
MAERPAWREAYDAAERVLSPRLEDAVRSATFAGVVSQLMRLQRSARRFAEQRSRRLWHAANLPAGSDVQRLREQVAALDRQVRRLAAALEDAADDRGGEVADGKPADTTPGAGDGRPRPSGGRAKRAARS